MTPLYAAARNAVAALDGIDTTGARAARKELAAALAACSADHIPPASGGWTPTVCVDLDGVLHRPERNGGVFRAGEFTGHPMPGAATGLRELMACFAVAVHTCRPPVAAARWIRTRLGVPARADDPTVPLRVWSTQGEVLVTNRKVPALAYLDDRALPFTGDWEAAVRMLLGLLPHPGSAGPAPARRGALARRRTES